MARAQGFALTHVDCTLICEFPKVGPHAAAMREAVAEMIGIEVGRVSVKATTSERLGFTGREEGIAALARATTSAEVRARVAQRSRRRGFMGWSGRGARG